MRTGKAKNLLRAGGSATLVGLGIVAPIVATSTPASAGPPPPGGSHCYSDAYGWTCENVEPHTLTHYISDFTVSGIERYPASAPSLDNYKIIHAGKGNPPAHTWNWSGTSVVYLADHTFGVYGTPHNSNWELCASTIGFWDGNNFPGPVACNSIHT
jgi:hypothetical protein